MSKIKGRLALLAGALALVIVGATASPAFAQHPDFPLGDTNPEHWSAAAVDVATAEFDSGDENLWGMESPWYMLPGLCTGGVEGSLGEDGSVEITAASWQGSADVCSVFQPGGLSWEGEICRHEPTDTFWVLQEMEFAGMEGMTGETFGEVSDVGIAFGTPPSGQWAGGGTKIVFTSPFSYEHGHAVFLPFDNDPELSAAEAPCGWAELQG